MGKPMTPRPMNATFMVSPAKAYRQAPDILGRGSGSAVMALNERPIIIKKIKKGGGAGHHGGAWKVAYADFVTAMMAFFLLMWLINTTSPEQKKGIADYFAPASVSETTSGAGGLLGGTSLGEDGAKNAGSQAIIEQAAPNTPNTQQTGAIKPQGQSTAQNTAGA